MDWHVVLTQIGWCRGMRGQAEVISTAIIVSVAVVVALGLVYYLNPFAARGSAEYHKSALLSAYSSSISFIPISTINDTNTISVFAVKDVGNTEFRLYMGVTTLYRNIPVNLTNSSVQAYIMSDDTAVVDSDSGWSALSGFNISSRHVFLYIDSRYYSLSEFIDANSTYTLFDLGIIKPGDTLVLKVVVSNPNPVYTYVVSLYARIGNDFYEIGRYTIITSSA
jgi:hypothetical protein